MNRPAPTLKDVAEAAEVSLATASLALRGKAPASKKTQERVRAIADRMGYRANPAIAAMATRHGRRLNAAVAVITSNQAKLPKPPRRTIEALTTACDSLGMDLCVVDTSEVKNAAAISRQLVARGVQGVFALRVWQPAQWWEEFGFPNFSVVSLDRDFSRTHPSFHLVRLGFAGMFTKLWEECHARGYRRVGSVTSFPATHNADHLSYLAMAHWRSLHDRSQQGIAPLMLKAMDERSISAVLPKARAWLKANRPDAVILQTLAFLPLIAGSGLPYAVGWEAEGEHTGIIAPQSRIGVQAAALMDMLIRSRLRGPQPEAFDIVVAPDWHEGTTLPPKIN